MAAKNTWFNGRSAQVSPSPRLHPCGLIELIVVYYFTIGDNTFFKLGEGKHKGSCKETSPEPGYYQNRSLRGFLIFNRALLSVHLSTVYLYVYQLYICTSITCISVRLSTVYLSVYRLYICPPNNCISVHLKLYICPPINCISTHLLSVYLSIYQLYICTSINCISVLYQLYICPSINCISVRLSTLYLSVYQLYIYIRLLSVYLYVYQLYIYVYQLYIYPSINCISVRLTIVYLLNKFGYIIRFRRKQLIDYYYLLYNIGKEHVYSQCHFEIGDTTLKGLFVVLTLHERVYLQCAFPTTQKGLFIVSKNGIFLLNNSNYNQGIIHSCYFFDTTTRDCSQLGSIMPIQERV